MKIFPFLLLTSVLSIAQPAGTFTPTGSMTVSRVGYSATLLPSGKVLIAGGQGSDDFKLASVEIYDPSTGMFIPAGNMTQARAGHSATLLPDGRVLITGGAFPRVTSAELYDPSTGEFSATADMLDGELGRAVLLANGKVLIAHGDLSAELYDPVLGTSSATGSLVSGFGDYDQQTIALLPDDRVLFVNCCQREQLYDPSTGAFSLTGAIGFMNVPLGVDHDGFAGARLANGNVLVSGGYGEETNTVGIGAAIYDWRTGVFVQTGNMTTPRQDHTATTLGDGTVLIAGSRAMTSSAPPLASAEIYDPVAGVFSPTANMTTGREGQTATLLLDGRVLIAASSQFVTQPSEGLKSAELYTPSRPVPAPILFSLSGEGRGQGAIWHSATGEVASASNPAVAGEALSMYTTSLVRGGAVPPQVAVGGRVAEILFFGDAPGYPGYFQVNFRVPNGASPGSAAPVRLTYLGRPSNETTIAIQ